MTRFRSWVAVVTAPLVAVAAMVLLPASAAGWGKDTHRRLVADAMGSVGWLDRYQDLKPTPFAQMVQDVLGSAKPVGAAAFKFKGAAKQQQKRQKYLASTASMGDAAVQRFARHLLLSNQLQLGFALGEDAGKAPSARQILSGYADEPDMGMDKGLDASKFQTIMGGTDPKMTSSQGFRHMAFLFGRMGQAPERAQLFFDLGTEAIQKGHPYWGFRFISWGTHYLADMGTPVHTNILPTSRYIRLKGMFFPKGKDGRRHFNKHVLKDLVTGSGYINANYHFLYERQVEQAYAGPDGQQLSAAVRGDGKRPGRLRRWLRHKLAPKSIKKLARRRAWSRLATPGIARRAIRYFTSAYRKPEQGAAQNTVRLVNKERVEQTVQQARSRLPGESNRAYRRRLRARDGMMRGTARQFRKNGVALRRAMTLVGQQLGAQR